VLTVMFLFVGVLTLAGYRAPNRGDFKLDSAVTRPAGELPISARKPALGTGGVFN
jgi:hypothetical protein